MANEMTKAKTRTELRKFGITVGLVFGVIAGLLFWRGRGAAPVLAVVSLFLLLPAFIAPRLLRPVEWIWMRVAAVLSFISTRVILTLAFFVVILPFGIALRIMGRDLLALKWEPDAPTYWKPTEVDGPSTRADKPY